MFATGRNGLSTTSLGAWSTCARLYSSVRRLRRPPLSMRRRAIPKNSKTTTTITNTAALSNALDFPTTDMACSMPTNYREMDNTALTTLGAMGNHAALSEMLKRHIMKTDQVPCEQAERIFGTIEKKNHESETILAVPFQVGITTCFVAGVLSIPLVFHLPTVEYFNEHFVTAEHPPTKELETALEVGAWSWNWMEPVMGTSTFLLLTLQYMRMHLQYLGVTPYATNMKRFRAKRLVAAFPQYNENLICAYSESAPMYNPKDLWSK